MGCDIHGVFQRKTETGWEDVPSAYDERRHYYLFAILAGVRNNWDLEPISEPRGLPADFEMGGDQHRINPEIATDFETRWADEPVVSRWMGGHSYSWLSGTEMLAQLRADDHLDYFFAEVKRLQDLYGEIRYVFGFDN